MKQNDAENQHLQTWNVREEYR